MIISGTSLGTPSSRQTCRMCFTSCRLFVESLPSDVAGFERIVLERDEGQVGQSAVRLQIIHESAHPRGAALSVGPDSNVFVDAFENGASQFQLGINFVNGGRPLKVERGVVFGHGVFAVGFLAHLDIRDG